jgi:hypothetical protein
MLGWGRFYILRANNAKSRYYLLLFMILFFEKNHKTLCMILSKMVKNVESKEMYFKIYYFLTLCTYNESAKIYLEKSAHVHVVHVHVPVRVCVHGHGHGQRHVRGRGHGQMYTDRDMDVYVDMDRWTWTGTWTWTWTWADPDVFRHFFHRHFFHQFVFIILHVDLLPETFCRGDVLLGDVLLQGDVLLRRRFVKETFC